MLPNPVLPLALLRKIHGIDRIPVFLPPVVSVQQDTKPHAATPSLPSLLNGGENWKSESEESHWLR